MLPQRSKLQYISEYFGILLSKNLIPTMPDLSALYFKDVAYYDRGIFAQLMTLRNL